MIVDGRDCGTVVFPHAEYKLFLTADPFVRALRWQKDQKKQGNEFSLEQAYTILIDRDARDTQRAHSPLAMAPDAHSIDNSLLDMEQTVQRCMQLIIVSQDAQTHVSQKSFLCEK